MSVKDLYSRALDFESKGERENALDAYDRVLALDPEHVGAIIGRKRVASALKRQHIGYTTTGGARGEKSLQEEHVPYYLTLSFSNKEIRSIDLSFLSSFARLEMLDFSYNSLTEISLEPLASCREMSELDLRNNRLRAINLEPLRSCSKLRFLYLQNNQLENIDLTPLAACKDLRIVALHSNKLQNVDLSPLGSCSLLVDDLWGVIKESERNLVFKRGIEQASVKQGIRSLRIIPRKKLRVPSSHRRTSDVRLDLGAEESIAIYGEGSYLSFHFDGVDVNDVRFTIEDTLLTEIPRNYILDDSSAVFGIHPTEEAIRRMLVEEGIEITPNNIDDAESKGDWSGDFETIVEGKNTELGFDFHYDFTAVEYRIKHVEFGVISRSASFITGKEARLHVQRTDDKK